MWNIDFSCEVIRIKDYTIENRSNEILLLDGTISLMFICLKNGAFTCFLTRKKMCKVEKMQI